MITPSGLADAVRDLYRRLPETYYNHPWELQHVLFTMGYVDGLVPEKEIRAAIEVARQDGPQWGSAA